MRPFFARVGLAALFVVSAGLVSLPSMAADKVSASVGKPLQEADKALKANDAATALAKVQEAQAVANRTPFDDFTINQFAANVALKQNDLKTAEKYFLAAAAYPVYQAGNLGVDNAVMQQRAYLPAALMVLAFVLMRRRAGGSGR